MKSKRKVAEKSRTSKTLASSFNIKPGVFAIVAGVLILIGGVAALLAQASNVVSPSGKVMPKGNLDGWRQIFADDFNVDAPKGSWGSECDWRRTAYRGKNEATSATSTESRWVSYPRCFLDTYQKRPYRADEVLSVRNGILNFELKPLNGEPAGANPSPLVTGSSQYQAYGRYEVRMRVVAQSGDLKEYYTAFLLWPQEDRDYPMSESDFPEGSLAGSQVCAFHHNNLDRTVQNHSQDRFCVNNDNKQWHTYTQEWGPGFRRYYIDGRLIGSSTKNVWSQPQRWQLQLETNTNSTSTGRGNVEVDWVTVYAWDPNARANTTTNTSPSQSPKPSASPSLTPTNSSTPTPTPTTTAPPVPSATPSPTPTLDTIPPTPPTNVKANLSFNATRFRYDNILKWGVSTDVGSGMKGYLVRRNGTDIGTSTLPTFTDTNILANIPYSYEVFAQDVSGNTSSPAQARLVGRCFLVWCWAE